jgi:hypothetical protein
MYSDVDVARKHSFVDISYKGANTSLSEGLVGKIIAARLDDNELAFHTVLSEQALDRLSLNQCEFAASGANTQYFDHALFVVRCRCWG